MSCNAQTRHATRGALAVLHSDGTEARGAGRAQRRLRREACCAMLCCTSWATCAEASSAGWQKLCCSTSAALGLLSAQQIPVSRLSEPARVHPGMHGEQPCLLCVQTLVPCRAAAVHIHRLPWAQCAGHTEQQMAARAADRDTGNWRTGAVLQHAAQQLQGICRRSRQDARQLHGLRRGKGQLVEVGQLRCSRPVREINAAQHRAQLAQLVDVRAAGKQGPCACGAPDC